jgi:hypothetical protein
MQQQRQPAILVVAGEDGEAVEQRSNESQPYLSFIIHTHRGLDSH